MAEQKHRYLVETTIALLDHSFVPLTYWFEALTTTTYLINRLPSPKLHHFSPYEALFQKSPDYSFLKTFGCQCFPWLRHKLQPWSITCVFIGYHFQS